MTKSFMIITISGTIITEAIGPFDSEKTARQYIAEGNGPKDTQKIIVPLSPLGLYVHPKFPRLTPLEESEEATA